MQHCWETGMRAIVINDALLPDTDPDLNRTLS